MSMKKPYIIGLKFGTWQSELWFSAEDDSETEKKWKKAVDSLTAVGIGCTHSNDFLSAAVDHFESSGFVRIQR